MSKSIPHDGGYFVFREAESGAETDTLVHLLCDVYDDSGIGHMAPRRGRQLVTDKYDTYSRYFGIYHISEHEETPIGCLRVVHGDRFDATDPDPLPMLEYFPEADEVRRFIQEQRSAGHTFTETGRMALLPEYRNAGLLEFIVDSVAAWGFLNGNVDLALTCPWPSLQRIYRRVGFTKIKGTHAHRIGGLGIQACSLVTTWDDVPDDRKPALKQLAREYRHHGFTRFDPVQANISVAA